MQVTQGELAEALGLTPRRIRQLSADNAMFQVQGDKKYNLTLCIQEYLKYKLEAETSRGNDLDYWEEKAKHEEAKRKITQIKLSRMRRESFDVADVEETWAALILDFREKLLSFPHKLAPLLIGEEDVFRVSQIIEEHVEAALWDLSEFRVDDVRSDEELLEDDDEEELPLGTADVRPPAPAKKANRKPVGRSKPKAASG